ncbi:hypothetical protein BD779DRAFT_1415763, partial [Infundibulicybe gibba]
EYLKTTWRSAVYGFFSATVTVKYDDDPRYEKPRKYHWFKCTALKCRGKGGIRRYQDSQDRAATSNLKAHATKCFGRDIVNAAFNNAQVNCRDGSVFAAFAQLSQPATVSHRIHTSEETRMHIVQWCTESHHSHCIVRDREFQSLMMAGRPSLALP